MMSKIAMTLGKFEKSSLEEFQKPLSKAELSEYSNRSFLATDRALKSVFEASFMIDQENAKQFERIEKKAQELREKEKRERKILKQLRNIYQQQFKEFQELEKVAKKALEQKSREVEILSMENADLKQKCIEFTSLKNENQLLTLKNQHLQSQTKRLSQQLASVQETYRSLKVEFEQQVQLLDKGIRASSIESESSTFSVSDSLQQVEQLKRDLEAQRKREFQLKQKTEEITKKLDSSDKLQKDFKERQAQLSNLTNQLQQLKKLCESQGIEIETQKQEIQIYQDSQKMRLQTDFDNRQNTAKNFEKFQQKLQELLTDKTLKQYTSVYDIFSSTINEIFKVWNMNMRSGNNSGEKFIENMMKIVENSLISLNDYFRQKSSLDVQRVQKMVGFIHNANNLLHKRNYDEDYIQKDEEKDIFVDSTPERSSNQPIVHSHNRQQSESSAKSKRRSILLEQDMDNAINYEEEMDKIREETLQEDLSSIKNSQIILDSLNDGSEKTDTIKDVLSDSSFSKSKFSELSSAQQNKIYAENQKKALLKGKLKKKKHHKQ